MPSFFRSKKHSDDSEKRNGSSGSATPPLPHDFISREEVPGPVADSEGLHGGAQVFVDVSRSDAGSEPVGEAEQARDHVHGGAVLLSPREGEPISGLPHDARGIETIVSSGAQGLGPEGLKGLRSVEASAKGPGEQQTVIAPAKGVAPEAVVTTEPPIKRKGILRKVLEPTSDAAHEPDEPKAADTNTLLNAVSNVMPESVLGANLAQLGMKQGETQAYTEQMKRAGSADSTGNAEGGEDNRSKVPTQLTSPGLDATISVPEGLLNIEKASAEDNEKFHSVFANVPQDDHLINDYSCALHRQVLLQGRIYLSQYHLCFHANILGAVTNLVIPLSELVTIEKRNTALVIPNAIECATLHARHTFASFLKRDDAFERIVKVWRFTHPETEVPTGDAKRVTILGDDTASMAHKTTTGTTKDTASMVSVETTDTQGRKVRKRKKLGKLISSKLSLKKHSDGDTSGEENGEEDDDNGDAKGGHPPTKCTCSGDDGHYKETALDAKFNATPDKIFKLIWDSSMAQKFLAQTENLTEISLSEWDPEFETEGATRDDSYIKPLNASMGPKSTKVLLQQKHTHVDSDSFYSTLTITKTPDVPAGSSFEVRTRTCITHAGGGTSRVFVTTEVHWHQTQRFLKSIIEKSAVEGQVTYHRDLRDDLRAHIRANADEFGGAAGDDDEAEGDEEDSAKGSKGAGFFSSFNLELTPSVIALSALVVVLLATNFYTLYRVQHCSPSDPLLDIEALQKAITALDERMTTIKARAARIANA